MGSEIVYHDNLPSIADAKLPAAYESAKTALAECSRLDECKDWADRAEALASYAKQAGDESLRKTADRIQARAIRRCGELLREIEPNKGGRPADEKLGRAPALVSPPTRKEAAKEAGLSSHQQKTAIRVANVSADDFEEAVESEAPPTVTALAQRGKQSAPKPLFDLNGRDPLDFQAATSALGHIRDLVSFASQTEPASIAAGASAKERLRLADDISELLGWLTELMDAVRKEGEK
jgi:hypothetical protein